MVVEALHLPHTPDNTIGQHLQLTSSLCLLEATRGGRAHPNRCHNTTFDESYAHLEDMLEVAGSILLTKVNCQHCRSGQEQADPQVILWVHPYCHFTEICGDNLILDLSLVLVTTCYGKRLSVNVHGFPIATENDIDNYPWACPFLENFLTRTTLEIEILRVLKSM